MTVLYLVVALWFACAVVLASTVALADAHGDVYISIGGSWSDANHQADVR